MVAWYGLVIAMLEKEHSFIGFIRFLFSTLLTFLSIGAIIACLYSFPKIGIGSGVTLLLFLVLVLAGLVLIAFLPVWPVAQAVSRRFVGPGRVLQATKGYRWLLIIIFFGAGSLDRIVPTISNDATLAEAIGLALCSAVVAAATMAFAASISVTAWKFAVKQDPSLADL